MQYKLEVFAIKVSIFDIFDEDWIYETHEKDLVRKSEARGIEIGEARARAEGEAEGEARGEAKATRSLVRSMFEEGFSDEMVARVIKRPVSEVQALKAELESGAPVS